MDFEVVRHTFDGMLSRRVNGNVIQSVRSAVDSNGVVAASANLPDGQVLSVVNLNTSRGVVVDHSVPLSGGITIVGGPIASEIDGGLTITTASGPALPPVTRALVRPVGSNVGVGHFDGVLASGIATVGGGRIALFVQSHIDDAITTVG